MGRALLELIITHYREDWAVCSKMFQMLDIQRGMAGGECRVTLVQDGAEGALDTARLMKKYAFITSVVEIPHGGISRARNAGLDSADAEYVMFCDCDDMLYSCDSLRTILDGIRASGGRADLIWGPMLIESREKDGRWQTVPQGWNHIFIHGKCWRLDWLREKNIRFCDSLEYSEDSLFCATAALEMDPARIGKLPREVYMWCLRRGSCTSDPENEARNREHLARRRCMMPGICMERGKPEDARTHALRAIYDSYHEYTGGTIPAAEVKRLEESVARWLVIPWMKETEKVDPDDAAQLWKISRESTERKGQREQEGEAFRDWVARLTAEYGSETAG